MYPGEKKGCEIKVWTLKEVCNHQRILNSLSGGLQEGVFYWLHGRACPVYDRVCRMQLRIGLDSTSRNPLQSSALLSFYLRAEITSKDVKRQLWFNTEVDSLPSRLSRLRPVCFSGQIAIAWEWLLVRDSFHLVLGSSSVCISFRMWWIMFRLFCLLTRSSFTVRGFLVSSSAALEITTLCRWFLSPVFTGSEGIWPNEVKSQFHH